MNKIEALDKAAELLSGYKEGEWNFEVWWQTHSESIEIRMNKIGINHDNRR